MKLNTAVKEMQFSAGLEEFLTFVRSTEELYRIATEDELRADQETQDILHSMELEDHTFNEIGKLGKKLIEVRQRRRVAKDTEMMEGPVVTWAEKNRATLKELERLLGEVRKQEKKNEVRIYSPRTTVLEDSG